MSFSERWKVKSEKKNEKLKLWVNIESKIWKW
jgi:hypothetical protein